MASRTQASAEARFMRGETGVDGASTKEAVDPAEAEQAKAKEALYRGRTWLGREALTWLLWKSESTAAVCELDGLPLEVVFTGRMQLRAAAGEVTEVLAKGTSAPYSALVKEALARGILVHGARLKLEHSGQAYEVTLDAECFDFRGAKLPELMQEEEAEQAVERVELVTRLGRLVDALISEFIAVRTSTAWAKRVVPELIAWLNEARPKDNRSKSTHRTTTPRA